MYLSLLVPLDRSSFAEQALPLALSIARRADARLDRHAAHSEAAQRPAAVRGHHNQGECGRSASSGLPRRLSSFTARRARNSDSDAARRN